MGQIRKRGGVYWIRYLQEPAHWLEESGADDPTH